MSSWPSARRRIFEEFHELAIFPGFDGSYPGGDCHHRPGARAARQRRGHGAAFGSGASGSLFGSSGSANFLSRSTGVLATVFFITSLVLAYVASSAPKTSGSVMQEAVQSAPVTQPAVAPEAQGAAVPAGSKEKDIPR